LRAHQRLRALGAFLIVQGAVQIVADADFLDTAGIVAFVVFIVWVFVVSVIVTRAVIRGEPA
jgi:hypothetical protein